MGQTGRLQRAGLPRGRAQGLATQVLERLALPGELTAQRKKQLSSASALRGDNGRTVTSSDTQRVCFNNQPAHTD